MMRQLVGSLVLGLLVGCQHVPATYQVLVTAETRAMILERPEFATVDCGGLRTTVVGADIVGNGAGQLLLSINCLDF